MTPTISEYKRVTIYVRNAINEPFTHQEYKDKEAALDVLRGIKAKLGEPRIGFVESVAADVLNFRFPGTAVVGRIVFAKRDVEEYVHCPSCGNALKRGEDKHSQCHGWHCEWVFDHDNGIWRVHTLSKEEL